MTTATIGQIKCIRAMIGKLHLNDQKDNMVSAASNGRTSSTSELTVPEATDLIRYLKSLDPEEQKSEIMRRKIIAMAHEMKWELPGGKADMKRIDGWMVNRSYLKKKLNQYQNHEMPKLVTQFEKVYRSFVEGF